MSAPSQIIQPVPFYYGSLPEDGVSQPLQAGFDYVLTAIYATAALDVDPGVLTINDENGKTILNVPTPSTTDTVSAAASWHGYLPLGPRTALAITATSGPIQVYVGGLALQPPTNLHI